MDYQELYQDIDFKRAVLSVIEVEKQFTGVITDLQVSVRRLEHEMNLHNIGHP